MGEGLGAVIPSGDGTSEIRTGSICKRSVSPFSQATVTTCLICGDMG